LYSLDICNDLVQYSDKIKNNPLVKTLNSFVNTTNNTDIIVSLSGGVDSMVLISILHIICYYKHKHNHNQYTNQRIIALHINYKNRLETDQEEEFLINWCNCNNIIIEIHHMNITRNNVDREFYEQETKTQRFDQYKSVLEKYNAKGIILAHHRGDEQENTFTNIVNGRNLLSIAAMTKSNIINDINIFRPFIDFPKEEIYNFAHEYNVPYFKDTTPDWSNRGKLRRQIFPLMSEVYGNKFLTNFTTISKESSEWREFIINHIINPFIKENITILCNSIHNSKLPINNSHVSHFLVTIKRYNNYPSCLWDIILKRINIVISKKAVDNFTEKLNNNFVGKIPLNKMFTAKLNVQNIDISTFG
jgi:tRNA(Ile)-lysidine synthetase-like protein